MRRFRKKVRRFVRLYWFWVSLGLVLTKVSVEAAYIERGYKAYGGEWLVLPVVMIVGYFVATKLMKLSLFNTLGSICGGMTSTPALGTLINVTGTDDVASAYAATYPVALVFVVLACQFIGIFL